MGAKLDAIVNAANKIKPYADKYLLDPAMLYGATNGAALWAVNEHIINWQDAPPGAQAAAGLVAGAGTYLANTKALPWLLSKLNSTTDALIADQTISRVPSWFKTVGLAAMLTIGGGKAYEVLQPVKPAITKTDPQTTDAYCGIATEGTRKERALLDTIAWAEGAQYNTLYGGGTFTNFEEHPNRRIRRWGLTSTAAGRYQFLKGTYDALNEDGLFGDGFTPEEQDRAALHLARTKRGLTSDDLSEALDTENFSDVGEKLKAEWASIPGRNGQGHYRQNVRSLHKLSEKFSDCYEAQE